MTLAELSSKQPVVALHDLKVWLDQEYSRNKRSREALLAYHIKQGHLLRVRQQCYRSLSLSG